MEYESILSLVGSVGFPIVVSVYLLVTLKKTIEENTRSNQAMTILLDRICRKLDIEP